VEARNLDYVVSACVGELRKGSRAATFTRVTTDSRQAQSGDLFFALAGERFDGHNFLKEVGAKGAAAVVVERAREPQALPDCAVISVDDTRQALGRLAAKYRNEFTMPVVAVGGSNGKTTVKNLIAAVLRQQVAAVWSEASFNNDIGVPLTLLRLDKSHQAAVVEVGTNHPGEMSPLLKMIRPRYGVITSIGREHLEFFGDMEGVAREEGMLAECLPPDGTLFVNGDDEWAKDFASRTRAKVVRVGFGEGNDWRAGNVRLGRQGTLFRLESSRKGFAGEYRLKLLGRHQVVNALFAAAVGEELGVGRPAVRDGLAECEPARMRLELWETGGVCILDDAYNANADSTLVALQVLNELPCKGRRVAVLGDMAELGAQTEASHAEVGRATAELGVGQLFAVGKMASVTAQAARDGGLNRVIEFADVESAAPALKTFLKTGDLVLLKGSRSAGLERIAEVLKARKA
jgi:UDP-N-acetylmuramoyl-tripeptide--D-alanyl-D-alanine ligase